VLGLGSAYADARSVARRAGIYTAMYVCLSLPCRTQSDRGAQGATCSQLVRLHAPARRA